MNIKIIITDDNNKHVLTESVENFSDARICLEGAEFNLHIESGEGNE